MTHVREGARYILSILLLLGGWAGFIALSGTPAYVLPAPLAVFQTLGREWQWFAEHAGATALNWAAGSTVGILGGVSAGGLLAYYPRARGVLEPHLVIFQSFPREALIPVIVVWLGFGAAPKIANAAILSFFPMAVVTMHSLLDTRREYVELVRSWGASRFEEFVHCRVPCSVHSVLAALKVSVPLALIGAVIGEFMGGNLGLGHVIISSGAQFRMDRSFAALIILASFGMTSLAGVRFLQEVTFKRFRQE